MVFLSRFEQHFADFYDSFPAFGFDLDREVVQQHDQELVLGRIVGRAFDQKAHDAADDSLDVVRFANERVDTVRDRVQRVFEQVVDQFGFTRVVPVQIPYRNIGPLGDRRYRTAEYPVLADDLDRSVADSFDFGLVHFFCHNE